MGRGLTCFLVTLFLIPIIVPSHEETLLYDSHYGASGSQPSLSLDVATGDIFTSDFNISGKVWDDELPDQLFWQLEEDGVVLTQNSAHNSLLENLSWADPNTRSWSFNSLVDTSELESCACRLTVIVIDAEQQVSEVALILFLRLDNSTLPPAVSIDSPESGISWRGNLLMRGAAISILGNQPLVKWGAVQTNLANHFCNRGSLDEYIEVESWFIDNIVYSGDYSFEVNIDITEYSDGWWLFTAMTEDSSGLSSHPACIAVALHNQRPTVQITGSENLLEGEVAHFDASNSDDPVWGKEGLMFTFMVRQVDSSSAPRVFDQGDNMSLNWTVQRSGVFDVRVIVTDTSGLSNSSNITLHVENVRPQASATIDGITFTTDDVVRLPDEQFWNVDASGSSDSVNDRGGLSFVWFVDGEPVSLGETQILRREWLKDESEQHLLTLTVTDDDGESDMVQVIVGIEGTPSDPHFTAPLTLSEKVVVFFGGETNTMVVFMLAMLIVTALTLRLAKVERVSEIPKWVPIRAGKHQRDNNEDEDVDFD